MSEVPRLTHVREDGTAQMVDVSAKAVTARAASAAGRVLLAPAMNVRMWQHPAVQANMERLKAFPGLHGVAVVGPDSGEMACGEFGPGRMADPASIADAIEGRLRMLAPVIDIQTRNGMVYVDLPPSDTARAGMFARGEFEIGASEVMTLPQSAVQLREGFSYVMRVGPDSRVIQTKVTPGRRLGDRVQIISGLDKDDRVVVSGAGAAGVAVTQLLQLAGVTEIVVCDSRGIIGKHRHDLVAHKEMFAATTNVSGKTGTIGDALKGADVYIGVSGGSVPEEQVASMADDCMIFALANPTPEVHPDLAHKYAAVVATGRSDYPNQINNVLAFPGVFRGLLDAHAEDVSIEMLIRAADVEQLRDQFATDPEGVGAAREAFYKSVQAAVDKEAGR